MNNNMKALKILATIFLFLALVSCAKDEEVIPQEETMAGTDIKLQVKTPFNGIFNQGQAKDITVRIREVGGQPTFGQIVIIIPPKQGFTFSFNPAKTFGNNPGGPVNNSLFSAVAYPGGSLFIYTNQAILANSELDIAIDVTASSTGSGTNAIFNAILLPGSGGDANYGGNETSINMVIL